MLFYQDFKDTFVCNTQRIIIVPQNVRVVLSGFQRYFCMQYTTNTVIVGNDQVLFYQDFKDTFVCNTQPTVTNDVLQSVVLSGFQRYFCMQYTTLPTFPIIKIRLFYQDFKDTFVCNTQLGAEGTRIALSCFIRISKILLYAIHNKESIL